MGCESGAAAAELALCLPMVMALMFGSFEGGNYMLTEHKVIKGVREGARYAARLPFAHFDCSSGAVSNADVEEDIINVTRTGQAGTGGAVRVSGWDAAEVNVSVSCDDTWNSGLYRDYGTAPRVLVSTTVPYPSILGTLGFDTSGAVVRAQAQAAVMGV
ncbi:pilus assembly protein TadE [Altererythrobacter aerius]|uniref:Pilus assembly protein TadE n=1 Tax=Tsuneonella aeria TaxID=1837929 RepID=A0A6I4TGI1_9SPHN|nr:TadE/TadG family type IV pilus assembly protein [Tsuneonella aeria]MXO75235.1 pilus assembly protein TadE [Tsuneonella aeria]